MLGDSRGAAGAALALRQLSSETARLRGGLARALASTSIPATLASWAAAALRSGRAALVRPVAKDIAEALRAAHAGEHRSHRVDSCMWEARTLAMLRCGNASCAAVGACVESAEPGKQCSRCRSVRYCCAACQVAGWGEHKKVCKELAARPTAEWRGER